MYFYVDESGNSGLHLFDQDQPVLLYGMVSSGCNLDVVAERPLSMLRKRFGVPRLHAAELGMSRLSDAAPTILEMVKRYDIRFDQYRLVKRDYAVMQFFDQVFDQGLNPAVPWTSYWTPLRYLLLLELAKLIDEETLKEAWAARIDKNDESCGKSLNEICRRLLGRTEALPDTRVRQIIGDALQWAMRNPEKLQYSADRKEQRLAISPNVIGFQFVLMGVVKRLRARKMSMTELIVDRQQQFNRAQNELATFYANAAGEVLEIGPGLPRLDLRHMPKGSINFCSSLDSAGLELVDLTLWLFKRVADGAECDARVAQLLKPLMRRGMYDELSLRAIAQRWSPFFSQLTGMEFTEEDMARATKLRELDEERRLAALAGIASRISD